MTFLPRPSLKGLLRHLAVAMFYAWLLYVGDYYFGDTDFVGHFEPASGATLAVLLIGGYQYAWTLLLCAILVHVNMNQSLLESLIISSADILQALLGVWLTTLDGKFDQRLLSLRSYTRLIWLGGCASVIIGALIMGTGFLYFGLIASKDYSHILLKWWMSDTLGIILIAPLILNWWWGRKNYPWRNARQMARLSFLVVVTVVACEVIFLDFASNTVIAGTTKGYWMFIVVAWAAVSFGIGETMLVLVITSVFALWGAMWGVGYFAYDIGNSHLVNYWFFMMILSTVGMTLATYIAEQGRILVDQRQFIAMLAHELKTPISVVRMALGAMDAQGKFKQHAELAMHDMDAIIERCQQVEHIEHGKFELSVQRCRLDELIFELADMLSPGQFHIRIKPLPDLNTDAQLLRIVLGNLLGNAVKYATQGTAVDIQAEPARRGNKPGIQLTIENLPGDAGLPDTKQIFKKYYRSPGAHGKSGSGLGLYLTRSVTEMLGGKVVYESMQRKARFTLWIPC